MIDYWLIFTLMLPFVEVLLHTYMENLNDDEDRTINHHGVAMDVGEKSSNTSVIRVAPSPENHIARSDLISKKEDIQVNALKELYDSYENNTSSKNKKKQRFIKKVSMTYIPLVVIIFVISYWIIGLRNSQFF